MSIAKKLGLSTIAASVVTFLTTSALAQPFGAAARGAAGGGANEFDVHMWAAAGAGFAIGLGVLGGTLGQGRAASAALEGISRNPGAAARIQTPMILGLALIESLVLLAFVIAFFLQGFAKTP
jgi:F-type H+-transporting ATPase subunit c